MGERRKIRQALGLCAAKKHRPDWAGNAIDALVGRQLKAKGTDFAPSADKPAGPPSGFGADRPAAGSGFVETVFGRQKTGGLQRWWMRS